MFVTREATNIRMFWFPFKLCDWYILRKEVLLFYIRWSKFFLTMRKTWLCGRLPLPQKNFPWYRTTISRPFRTLARGSALWISEKKFFLTPLSRFQIGPLSQNILIIWVNWLKFEAFEAQKSLGSKWRLEDPRSLTPRGPSDKALGPTVEPPNPGSWALGP